MLWVSAADDAAVADTSIRAARCYSSGCNQERCQWPRRRCSANVSQVRGQIHIFALVVFNIKLCQGQKEDFTGLGRVTRMDHQRVPQQALYWEVPGYKRGPGRPRTNWSCTVNKDLDKRWGSAGRKQSWQLLTDTNGIGVRPNVSTWMRDESRSWSRSRNLVCQIFHCFCHILVNKWKVDLKVQKNRICA